jgi:hypothetical protein
VRSAEVPPPTIQILRPVGEVWVNQATVPVEGALSGEPPLSVTVNGQVASVTQVSFTATVPLEEGSNQVTARVTDGRNRSAEDVVTVSRDTVAPRILVTEPATGSVLSTGTPRFVISYEDPSPGSGLDTGSFGALLDGDSITGRFDVGPAEASYGPTVRIDEGPHSFLARVADRAGNTGEGLSSFIVDAIPQIEPVPVHSQSLDDAFVPAPPDVVASKVIPPILRDENELIFLNPDGTLRSRIDPSNGNPTTIWKAARSPNGERVIVSRAFDVVPDEDGEGCDIPLEHTLMDRSGQALSIVTTGTCQDYVLLSDSGVYVLRDPMLGTWRMMDGTTGAPIERSALMDPNSGITPPCAEISPEGNYVATGLGQPTLDGKSGLEMLSVRRTRAQLLAGGRTIGWVGLYRTSGERLWKVQLPDDGRVTDIVVAPEARYILVTSLDSSNGRHHGYILDHSGNIVASEHRGKWKIAGLGAYYQPDLEKFVLGGRDFLVLVAGDGGTTQISFKNRSLVEGLYHGERIACVATPSYGVFLAYAEERLHLVIIDGSRRCLLQGNISSFFDGSANPSLHPPLTGPTLDPKTLSLVRLKHSATGSFLFVKVGRLIRIFDLRRV